jgi:hypothetical protein
VSSPTVDDALQLLRDPSYRVGIGGRRGSFAVMNGRKILDELRAPEAEDDGDALALVHAALDRIGGQDASEWIESESLGSGRWGRTGERLEVFLVPLHEQV